jgi:energy-converting hydrogenase Eha subunit E
MIIIGIIIYSIIKGKSGIKVMIMGIQFSLLGLALIFMHYESDLTPIGFMFMIIGLLVSTFGLIKREK